MFKNRSFQKAILILAILALLAGLTIASLPHTSLLAGLPPCSPTFGNCKLGISGVSAPSGLFFAQIKRWVNPSQQGEEVAILVAYPRCGYRC